MFINLKASKIHGLLRKLKIDENKKNIENKINKLKKIVENYR